MKLGHGWVIICHREHGNNCLSMPKSQLIPVGERAHRSLFTPQVSIAAFRVCLLSGKCHSFVGYQIGGHFAQLLWLCGEKRCVVNKKHWFQQNYMKITHIMMDQFTDRIDRITHWAVGNVVIISKVWSLNMLQIKFMGISCEIALWWISQNIFDGKSDKGLVPSCKQAITWVSCNPDLCHHMVSLGHKELAVRVVWFHAQYKLWV